MQNIRQNALNGSVQQSYALIDVMDSLPAICKDNLAPFVGKLSSVLEGFDKQFCLGL